jgi:hypothetical protein
VSFRAENTENTSESAPENTTIRLLAQRVMILHAEGEHKPQVMRKVWGVNPGDNEEYRKANAEYKQVMLFIAETLGA